MPEDLPGHDAEAMVDRILRENAGDCMSLGMFAHHVTAATAGSDADLLHCLQISLHKVLVTELMVAGDLDHHLHIPWTCTPDEAWERINRHLHIGTDISYESIRDICWLANSPEGDSRALANTDFLS